jgi:hypothetical protein
LASKAAPHNNDGTVAKILVFSTARTSREREFMEIPVSTDLSRSGREPLSGPAPRLNKGLLIELHSD